jgi:hypothetical protein
MTKPTLDEMIDAAAKLPPGPDAWAPIFAAYPEITVEELAEEFQEADDRYRRWAQELRVYARSQRFEEHLRSLAGATELARNEHGDTLYASPTGCSISRPRRRDVGRDVEPISKEQMIDALGAVTFEHSGFEHWCLSGHGEEAMKVLWPGETPF